MTAKQILDAFSETLMQDERILSPRERELLTSLLQNSKTVSGNNPQTQSAVAAAIAQSVGETVAQRAFALLGGRIVEQILAGSAVPASVGTTTPTVVLSPVPQPPGGPGLVPKPPIGPGKVPQPPSGPGWVPQPPGGPLPPTSVPQPPSGPKGLQPLSAPVQRGTQPSHLESGGSVGVLEAPAIVLGECV